MFDSFKRLLPGTLSVGLTCALSGNPSQQPIQRKPNIIFLLTDDQSSYTLGCYGNRDVKTPNIDRLGNDGVIFTRHYNTTSICMASRANIFTGMYEYKTGTNFGHGGLSEEKFRRSYPVLLRKAGYMTAFAGKFGIGYPLEQTGGKFFDIWAGAPGQTSYRTADNPNLAKYAKEFPHSTLAYGAFARDVIRKAVSAGKPFCLSISFKAPHRPALPDPRFKDLYKGKKFTKPLNFGREHGTHFSEQSKKGRQYERFISWGYATKYDEVMRRYHQQVYGIDVAVGMIREELQRQGIAGNTVIIFTSDNGFFCGSHGYGSKVLPYEESASVPLIIYDPRHPVSGKKVRCDSLTANIDIAPTILQLAGLPIPKNMDGKSLLPLLDNPRQEIHDSILLINTWGSIPTWQLAVVTPQWKYIHWWYSGEGMEPVDELYDMRHDRLELKNLAKNPEYQPQLEQMRKLYDQHLVNWQRACEPHYRMYATLFDRNKSWSEKAELLEKNKAAKPAIKKKKKKKKQSEPR